MKGNDEKFADALLIGCIGYLTFVLGYLVYKGGIFTYTNSFYMASALIICCLIVLVYILKGTKSFKIPISIILTSTGFCTFLAELLLTIPILTLSPFSALAWYYETWDIEFDRRSIDTVIQDFKAEGVNAFPALVVTSGVAEEAGASEVLPLGGISLATTILGNESGQYIHYQSDEHGFRNPIGGYNQLEIDIALLGDSFVQGFGVADDEVIGAFLRRAGYTVLNLGYNGNASLKEYAAFKEYALPLKPSLVLWCWFPNDIDDLFQEMNSPILMRYLEADGFNQNLLYRQLEIDRYLLSCLERRDQAQTVPSLWYENALVRFLVLSSLRTRLGMTIHSLGPTKNEIFINKMALIKEILAKSDHEISGFGGQLCFVYLPAMGIFKQVSGDISKSEHHALYHQILDEVRSLDIPIIDIYSALADHPDPSSLFPFSGRSPMGFGNYHYNAAGYQFVAETIIGHIKTKQLLE